MKIKYYPPTDILKPFIKTFMIIESEEGRQNKILPDTSIVMALRYKGDICYGNNGIENSLPSAVITGIQKKTRIINYSKHSGNLLVLFTETGATAFFKTPLHELFEQSLSLDYFLHSQTLKDTEEQLYEAKNDEQRIVRIETMLIAALKNTRIDLLIKNAVQKIKAARGNIKVKELAQSLFISQDAFEKRFRRRIGTTPKQFSSIIRLKSIIETYPRQKSFTEAAYAAGYFDQAHFIRDFSAFTGQTPAHFFKDPVHW